MLLSEEEKIDARFSTTNGFTMTRLPLPYLLNE